MECFELRQVTTLCRWFWCDGSGSVGTLTICQLNVEGLVASPTQENNGGVVLLLMRALPSWIAKT